MAAYASAVQNKSRQIIELKSFVTYPRKIIINMLIRIMMNMIQERICDEVSQT